jgi:hypothetical protein
MPRSSGNTRARAGNAVDVALRFHPFDRIEPSRRGTMP